MLLRGKLGRSPLEPSEGSAPRFRTQPPFSERGDLNLLAQHGSHLQLPVGNGDVISAIIVNSRTLSPVLQRENWWHCRDIIVTSQMMLMSFDPEILHLIRECCNIINVRVSAGCRVIFQTKSKDLSVKLNKIYSLFGCIQTASPYSTLTTPDLYISPALFMLVLLCCWIMFTESKLSTQLVLCFLLVSSYASGQTDTSICL